MNRRLFLIFAGLSLSLAACNPMKKRNEECDPRTSDCTDQPSSRSSGGPDIGAHEFGAEAAFFPNHDVGAPSRPEGS